MAILDTLAAHLGRPLSTAEQGQAELWAGWVSADIDAAAVKAGRDAATIPSVAVERFTIAAITRRWVNPDQLARIDISVDDGRVSRTPIDARMAYLPEWWAWLGLPDPDAAIDGWSGSIGYGGRP